MQLTERVVAVVTEEFGIPLEDIIRQARKKEIAEARQVIAYCLRLLSDMSFPTIGEILGGRDHTTIMHSCSKIAHKIEQDTVFKERIDAVLNSIRTPAGSQIDERPESISRVANIGNETQENLLSELDGEKRLPDSEIHYPVVYDIPKNNLELTDREKKILEKYRRGKTLQEIAEMMGVTRERIRQISLKATLKEIGAKIKDGFEIDVNEYMKGEKLTHELARYVIPEEEKQKLLEDYIPKASSYTSVTAFAHDIGLYPGKFTRMFPEVVEIIENNFREKKDRWSRFYTKCRGCGTTTIPHARQGYCEKCSNGRSVAARESILGQDTVCAVCSIDRGSAIRKYGKDLFIMKDNRVLCRGCFLQFTGNRLAESRWGHH